MLDLEIDPRSIQEGTQMASSYLDFVSFKLKETLFADLRDPKHLYLSYHIFIFSFDLKTKNLSEKTNVNNVR